MTALFIALSIFFGALALAVGLKAPIYDLTAVVMAGVAAVCLVGANVAHRLAQIVKLQKEAAAARRPTEKSFDEKLSAPPAP